MTNSFVKTVSNFKQQLDLSRTKICGLTLLLTIGAPSFADPDDWQAAPQSTQPPYVTHHQAMHPLLKTTQKPVQITYKATHTPPNKTVYTKQNPPIIVTTYDDEDNTFTNWYTLLEGGASQPSISSDSVDNGSNFASPYNMDFYSTKKTSQGFASIGAGYFWTQGTTWFSAFGLGLRYRYMIPQNIGGQVTQYTLPEFTNYNYQLKIASNTLTAQTKLNFIDFKMLAPYVSAGLGLAINNAEVYSETALPSVTSRISPGFGSKTNNNFTYNFGVGLDLKMNRAFNQQLVLSLGYEYQNLGKIKSSNGVSTWSNTSLNLGTYVTNLWVVGLAYLY